MSDDYVWYVVQRDKEVRLIRGTSPENAVEASGLVGDVGVYVCDYLGRFAVETRRVAKRLPKPASAGTLPAEAEKEKVPAPRSEPTAEPTP